MTVAPENRRLLPTVAHARGKRSPITCELKCGNACDGAAPNNSANPTFRDIATAAFSRRSLLGGLGVAAAGFALGAQATPAAASSHGANHWAPGGFEPYMTRGDLRFQPIAPVVNTTDAVTVPEGYRWHPIIRWGDPLFADSPAFNPNNQTAAAQAKQFGYNNDYLDIIHLDGSGKRAVLVANHEYTNENIMFPPGMDAAEAKRIALAAHGFSIVELRRRRRGDNWQYQVGAPLNRRITAHTPMTFSGPAAGSALLKTKADATGRNVLGTLNNCSGSTTPWGTILSGEENFNQYFVASESPANKRYGIPSSEGGRKWWTVDPRFDARIAGNENEVNRFGWIVEIDPMDPTSTPVKHTALGRFKHEAAAVRLTWDGRAAAYSGDDERFDYVYKFVSRNRFKPGRSRKHREWNKQLLSEGDLYVARFEGDSPATEITGTGALPLDGQFDGKGTWLPLVVNNKSMVADMSVEEVLVFTRLAADKVGATKMDRPEDVEPNPKSGRVYIACTNNSDRGKTGKPGVDEANPRALNREGHVVELIEDRNDAGALTFRWNLILVCGKPETAGTYFGGYAGPVSPISCPDNVAFDSRGNLWVSTDGQPGSIGLNDALHKVPVRGGDRGKVQQFLAVPRDAETCGPVIHDQEDTVYVAVQHPGEDGTWDAPTSLFPDYINKGEVRDGKWGGPRPAVIQVTKNC